jgi:hypothetical protein
LGSFTKAITAAFQDGLPLHIAKPNKLVFAIMTEGKWLKHEEDAEVKEKMTESDKYDNVMVG